MNVDGRLYKEASFKRVNLPGHKAFDPARQLQFMLSCWLKIQIWSNKFQKRAKKYFLKKKHVESSNVNLF